jgi:hypothetical protein
MFKKSKNKFLFIFFISIFVLLSQTLDKKNFVFKIKKIMWATGATHTIVRVTGSTLFAK